MTTRGFADIIEIARQHRPSLYDPFVDRPTPLVPRALRFEVDERLDAAGSVLTQWDGTLPALPDDVEAVALCLLHSDRNAEPEATIAGEAACTRVRRDRFERALARVPRVRAHGHDRRQRVPAARVRSVPRTDRRVRGRGARDDVGRRSGRDRGCAVGAGRAAALRSGRRRAGRGRGGGRVRTSRRGDVRHGRYQHRRVPRARRRARAGGATRCRRVPDPPARARHPHDRGRGRIDRAPRPRAARSSSVPRARARRPGPRPTGGAERRRP